MLTISEFEQLLDNMLEAHSEFVYLEARQVGTDDELGDQEHQTYDDLRAAVVRAYGESYASRSWPKCIVCGIPTNGTNGVYPVCFSCYDSGAFADWARQRGVEV